MNCRISVLWDRPPGIGSMTIHNAGSIQRIISDCRQDIASGPDFKLDGGCRLEAEIEGAKVDEGPCATVVGVRTQKNPFSFFLRDVSRLHPIFIPQYGVIVTESGDERSYAEILSSIKSGGRKNRLEQIESQPEESYEAASKATRNLKCVTWLGLSRDIRNFEVNFHGMKAANDLWDSIQPKYHGMDVTLPELDGKAVKYDYFCGRGFGCTLERRRWLEKRVLPILNACLQDDEISYNYQIFVSTEKSPLKMENVRGTHYLVADKYSWGSMFTDEQAKRRDELHDGELETAEETVCYIRVAAVNTGSVPKYSFMRLPQPNVYTAPDLFKVPVEHDPATGFSSYKADRVFLVASLNGKPVPAIETTVLLAPGARAEYILKIPHRPISAARAEALGKVSFQRKLEECIGYWETKLNRMAGLELPEQRIGEMMKAGMLHCDLVAYGNEPDGALAPTIGIYSPIGSESAPIIQYLDAMGLHDLARRCIMYFVERQHEDGFMQNCGGYMLETGCVLWTMGEHWRYTRDKAWVESVRMNIVKAVDYIAAWRERNKTETLRGHGYGMINGKVADCEDNFHIFMLNSTAYVGVKRAAEMLAAIGDPQARRIALEAADFLEDIRASLDAAFAEAPAIPLGDGSWCPSMPVWAEMQGSPFLHVDGGTWFSHGTALLRDTVVSTQYLLLDEVIAPDHLYADFILNGLADNYFKRNVCFSQPYYSPHPWANLRRGEVKAFLKEFYSNMSALADRETYTFWEHFFYASPHKTHEEGWFLMRCRWMLYLETEDALTLLPGAPRAWLEDGMEIAVDGAASYFGPVSFRVASGVSSGKITCWVKVDSQTDRLPARLAVRVPHPAGLKASRVSDGVYDPPSETVVISGFSGEVSLEVVF